MDSCQGEIMLDAGQCRARCELLKDPAHVDAIRPEDTHSFTDLWSHLPYCQRLETFGYLDPDKLVQTEFTERDTIRANQFDRGENHDRVNTTTNVIESDVIRRRIHRPWAENEDRSRPNAGVTFDQALIRGRARQWITEW
jgi:hypothetical protein